MTEIPFQGTALPSKVSGRSMQFQDLAHGVPSRIPEMLEPRTAFFVNPRDAKGEVTEEARTPGWTVQRPRTRQHLPTAMVKCVACWAGFDPNDWRDHDCPVMRAARV